MSDNGSADTVSSLCEEDRLRRLFCLCDANGDGFIDSGDIFSMCQELGMENAFDEIVSDLGAGPDGLISLEEFVRRGLSVHASNPISSEGQKKGFKLCLSNNSSDIEDFDSGLIMTSEGVMSTESLGGAGAKIEAWKRDLISSSTNPMSSGTSLAASGENSRTSSMGRRQPVIMDSKYTSPTHARRPTANGVQQSPNLKTRMSPRNHSGNPLETSGQNMKQDEQMDCKWRVQQKMASEKSELEKRLLQLEREKSSLQSELETRLESQAQRYEERITELHAVIFDINKRYDQLHGDTIREEDEEFLEEVDEENEDAASNSNSSSSAPPPSHVINQYSTTAAAHLNLMNKLNPPSSVPSPSSTTSPWGVNQPQRQPASHFNPSYSSTGMSSTNANGFTNRTVGTAAKAVGLEVATNSYQSEMTNSTPADQSGGNRGEKKCNQSGADCSTINTYTQHHNQKADGRLIKAAGISTQRSSPIASGNQKGNKVIGGGHRPMEFAGGANRTGDPYTTELDALETCSTSTHCCCESPYNSPQRTSGTKPKKTGSNLTAEHIKHLNGANTNNNTHNNHHNHHELEALSTDFELVVKDCCDNKTANEFDDDNCCCRFDDLENVNSDDESNDDRLTPDAFSGTAEGERMNAKFDPKVTSSGDNGGGGMDSDFMDDDSLILAIERQTAMACKELAKLELSNQPSRTPIIGPSGRTQSKQNLTSPTTNSVADEKVRQKNEVISNLDSQLNKCKKENEELRRQLSVIEVEKRDLEKRLEATQKQLQGGGGAIRDDKNNNVAMSAYNSLTLPNKFNKQLSSATAGVGSKVVGAGPLPSGPPPLLPPRNGSASENISKLSSKPSNTSDSSRSLNLTSDTNTQADLFKSPSSPFAHRQNSSSSHTTETISDVTTSSHSRKCNQNNNNNNNNSEDGGDSTPQADDRIIELELQLNKSVSKVDRIQSEVDLLQLTLEESKSTSERLALLCGKYESNTTALKIALDYSDLCVEALESLLALGSSAGVGRSPRLPSVGSNSNQLTYSMLGEFSDCEDEYAMLGIKSYVAEEEEKLSMKQKSRTSRRHAETVAKTILSHLDTTFAKANRVICGENNLGGMDSLSPSKGGLATGGSGLDRGSNNMASPFASGSNVDDCSSQDRTSTTSSTNSATSVESDWSKLDENRLRDYIRQLKTETTQVRLTVVELESIYMDPEFATQMKRKKEEEQQQLLLYQQQQQQMNNGTSVNNVLSVDEMGQRRERLKQEADMLAAFESQRQDLEYAVLTQELMTLKEEKAELRAQMYLIEKEKKQMNTMKASHDAQLNAYSVQVDHLKQLLEQQKINNNNNSSNGQSGDNQIKQGGSTGSDSGVGGTSQKPKMGSTSSSHSYQGSATGIKGQTGVGGFSQSPRSAFSTLSSSASASKSEPVSGSEHNSSFSANAVNNSNSSTTPIITLEQLSSVAGGRLGSSAGGPSSPANRGHSGVMHSERSNSQQQTSVASAAVEIAAAKKREEKLKGRMEELVSALDTLSKHCEVKDRHSAEYMADLKRANSALISAYDKAKKKHSSRLKKLECQMKAICERHETTVKVLRQRINLLEEGERVKQNISSPPSETSL
ncbi:uncharacterized protein LOC134846916 isoform X3 [Symsagittifera roscoffensis]|uniref:uncharacterized protein LOC134846916 isoform X3 n=1 Tax=Symsagittifera roscoffensis TaxID=84072 RepID=UPI00307C8F2B